MIRTRAFKARSKRGNFKSSKALEKKALKMLSIMSSSAENSATETTKDISQDFLTTGRTGRRNALPDIMGHHNKTSTGDLASKFEGLTTSTDGGETSSSCGTKVPECSSNSQEMSASCSSNDKSGTSSS